MLNLRPIESIDQPELAPYRTMRRPNDHWQQGIFVAEGEKVVRRLLDSDLHIISVVMPQKWFPEFEPLLQKRKEFPQIFVAENKGILENLTGFSMFQGVLGLANVPATGTLLDVVNT